MYEMLNIDKMAHWGSSRVQTNDIAFKLYGKHHKNAKIIILTQRAYLGNGETSCFILQQIHWAETRDVI